MPSFVTVVIPVKNEESNLPECLSRLKGFDKVLVVDSGSTDGTCAIATEWGAEVLQFSWNGKFPKKRSWVLRTYNFTTDWVLFLDADEYITDAFKAALEQELPESSYVGYWLNYDRWFLGKRLRGGDEFTKLALFRVGAGEYEAIEEEAWSDLDMEIHEHPVLKGGMGEIAEPIEHNEYRGLHHYIAKHNAYSSWEAARYCQLVAGGEGSAWNTLTPRQRKKYRHLNKWWATPVYFIRAYIFKGGFRDGAIGFHFALMKAIYFYQIRLKVGEKVNR